MTATRRFLPNTEEQNTLLNEYILPFLETVKVNGQYSVEAVNQFFKGVDTDVNLIQDPRAKKLANLYNDQDLQTQLFPQLRRAAIETFIRKYIFDQTMNPDMRKFNLEEFRQTVSNPNLFLYYATGSTLILTQGQATTTNLLNCLAQVVDPEWNLENDNVQLFPSLYHAIQSADSSFTREDLEHPKRRQDAMDTIWIVASLTKFEWSENNFEDREISDNAFQTGVPLKPRYFADPARLVSRGELRPVPLAGFIFERGNELIGRRVICDVDRAVIDAFLKKHPHGHDQEQAPRPEPKRESCGIS